MNLTHKEIKLLLQKEDPIFLEIGAHKGNDTKKFLSVFKDINIYCFEPDPRCIKVFKALIDNPRCTLIEAAISNKDGTTFLNLSSGYHPRRLSRFYNLFKTLGIVKYIFKENPEWDYSSSIKESISHSKKYPWLTFNKKFEVQTIRLDSWIKSNNINNIDFIWADIQGAEKDMIEGAVNTLKIVKYIYTEYGETSSYPEAMTREETIELLKKHNFEIIPKYSDKGEIGNLLFKNSLLN